MTTRYITGQQFSDGTTIDGNRIEAALQALESVSDNVPRSAIRTRFTQTMLVAGWSPVNDAALLRRNPFMGIFNSGTGNEKNVERFKGTSGNEEYSDLVAWETSAIFDHPSVLHGLSFVLAQSTSAPVPYQFPGIVAPYDPPEVRSVEIQVSIDAEYVPNDRTQSDMEIHKQGFSTNSWVVSAVPIAAPPATEMLPVYPGSNLTGWSIDLRDMNIPVRSFGVVRIALIIPDEVANVAVWGTRPWRNFSPTLTATFLEPTRDV